MEGKRRIEYAKFKLLSIVNSISLAVQQNSRKQSQMVHLYKSCFMEGRKTNLFKLKVDITHRDNGKFCRNKQSGTFLFLQRKEP